MKHHAPAARPPSDAVPSTASRFDMYALVHKGLRAFMGDTLLRLGSVDADDTDALGDTLAQLRTLLALWSNHAELEERFIHSALQARRAGSACVAAEQHVWQEREMEVLHQLANRLERAAADERAAVSARLYLEYSRAMAEWFEHMYLEETSHNPVLWETHSDDELKMIHAAILEAVPVQHNATCVRWIAPHVTPQQRAAMLTGMRARAPVQAFAGVLALTRAHLRNDDWDKLARALDAAPAQPAASMR